MVKFEIFRFKYLVEVNLNWLVSVSGGYFWMSGG